MKSIILFCILILVSSAASAEIYKWEDSNGVHMTDNPYSVPEKYRQRTLSETKPESVRNTLQVDHQVRGSQAIEYQVDLEQQRRTESMRQQAIEQQRRVETLRLQQAKALAVNNQKLEGAFQSLAGFMMMWIMFGMIVFIVYICTIVDIVKSEFSTPSNKTVWMLLVLFIPMIGMVLYFILGSSQKSNSRHQSEALARLRPRDPRDRDFRI